MIAYARKPLRNELNNARKRKISGCQSLDRHLFQIERGWRKSGKEPPMRYTHNIWAFGATHAIICGYVDFVCLQHKLTFSVVYMPSQLPISRLLYFFESIRIMAICYIQTIRIVHKPRKHFRKHGSMNESIKSFSLIMLCSPFFRILTSHNDSRKLTYWMIRGRFFYGENVMQTSSKL